MDLWLSGLRRPLSHTDVKHTSKLLKWIYIYSCEGVIIWLSNNLVREAASKAGGVPKVYRGEKIHVVMTKDNIPADAFGKNKASESFSELVSEYKNSSCTRMDLNAFNRPFRKHDENTRTAWGYSFQLSSEHPTAATFQTLKFSYDELGEEALERLNVISPPAGSALPRNDDRFATMRPDEKIVPEASVLVPKRDLYSILQEHAHQDPVLGKLWQQVNTIPEWVDWEQLERGQDVFYRYGGPNLTGLAFQSLLGGLGAARVVETLSRTGGFRTSVVRHRLYETTQHILQVTSSLDSLKPGGAGFASSVRVRLLHAAVRKRIMSLVEKHPSYYNVEEWGVPINDLDCIATIGTFSATLVWLSLPRQGIFLRKQEIEDYMALWKYVGYLTGTPVSFIDTPLKAQRFMESLLMMEVRPSDTSRILAANMLEGLAGQPPQLASKDFLLASARWLNGNELCNELALEKPSAWYYALFAGQCFFFMGMCYFYRTIPLLDKRKIKTLKRLFWLVIVEGKYGLKQETYFDFKYIPDLHKTTLAERGTSTGLVQRGIERRNFIALSLACALSVAGAVVISYVLRAVTRSIYL